MARKNQPPPSYLDRLLTELDAIAASYQDVIGRSTIEYVNPNRPGSRIVFVAAADYGWAKSDEALKAARMSLLATLRDWTTRFRLLFPDPLPEMRGPLKQDLGLLERWLERPDEYDHDIPRTTAEAATKVQSAVERLKGMCALLPADDWPLRLVVDTNTLIDNPDLAVYVPTLGARYLVHVMPVVLREVDDLKRSGRTPELRAAAERANRRLKGLRTNGDVLVGAKVAGDVWVKFEHVEPRLDGLPSWLDLDVPDDQFVAATLRLQSQHPGSTVTVASSDINLQTKLSAVGLPFIEPPEQ